MSAPPNDRAASSAPLPVTGRNAWLGLVAISLGVALVVVDFTIVNVIMPPVIQDLGISSSSAQWVQESYAIVLAALLLVMGRLSDILGARRLFLIGTIVFGLASIVAAAAPSGSVLIAGRIAQGLGAAIVMPTSLALLNSTFYGPDRGKAFAIWGSTIGAAAAVGPLLGGWLGEYSWRWAFAINIVVVALILVGVVRYLSESPLQPGAVDVPGSILSVVGLGALAFGLIEGRSYGWWTAITPDGRLGSFSMIPVILAVAVVALVLFVLRQIRLTSTQRPEPLVDTALFAIRSFSSGNLAALIVGLAEFGILAVLPLWLQFTQGYSTLQTGLMIFVVAAGSFLASGASFGMAEQTSAVGLVRIGLALEVVGLLCFAVLVGSDTSWWVVALGLFIYGAGVGFATAQVSNVVLAEVDPVKAGQGSGIQTAARQLGSALGVAVLTSAFFTTLGSSVTERLGAAGVAPADAGRVSGDIVSSAGAVIPGLGADPAAAGVADAARDAMSDAVSLIGWLCAALLALGLATTWLIPRRPTTAPRPASDTADGEQPEPAATARPGATTG